MVSTHRQHDKANQDRLEELSALRRRVAELEKMQLEDQRSMGETIHPGIFNFTTQDKYDAPLGVIADFFGSFFNQVDVFVFVKDLAGRYTFINSKTENIFKIRYGELRLRTFTDLDFFDGGSLEIIRENDKQVLDRDEALQFEERLRLRRMHNAAGNGQEVIFFSHKFPLKDQNGNPLGICCFANDIGEHREREGLLIKDYERSELALQGATDGLWDWDVKSGEVYYSPRWKGMLGYAEDEVANSINEWKRLIAPEDRERTVRMLGAYKEGSSDKFECEMRMLHKDGRTVDVLSRAITRQLDSTGNVKRMVGIQVDITARKRAEQELREIRRLLYTVVNNAPIWLFTIDNNGVYTLSIGQGLEILGFVPGELVGRSVYDVYPDKAQILEQSHRALMGETFTSSMQLGKAIFETLYSPLRDLDGEIIGVVGVSTDITQRVNAEDALLKAKIAAETGSHAKSEFLANISHELRTPLNGILGYTHIMKMDKSLTEPQIESLNVIERSGEHLLKLVNEILDLSKVQAGKMTLKNEAFNLDIFLQGIIMMFRSRAQHQGIDFIYRSRSALPTRVHGDEMRLSQVLLNLLDNALKFTREGKVCLDVGYNFDKLRFQVEDSGIGVQESDLKAIFEPFHQVGDPKLISAGTGLGLSISSSLVEMMGGKLQVRSTPGEGSVFWFEVELPVIEGWSMQQDEDKPRIIRYDGKHLTVMVVSPKKENCILVKNLLIPLDITVMEARDGKSALRQVSNNCPDIMFLDLLMPEMNGFEIARIIRQNPELVDQVKIVAVSDIAFGEHRYLSLRAGCDGFLARPYTLDMILGEIEKHLGTKWIYEERDNVHDQPVSTQHPALPSPEMLEKLRLLSLKGQIVEIKSVLEEIQAMGPAFDPFVKDLYPLAQEFKLREMRKRIDAYLLILESWGGGETINDG